MKKTSLILLMIFISSMNFAQNCNCSTNLKWLIETFEKNDAGFQYVIDKKGENAYLTHNNIYIEKASKIKEKDECLNLLNDWTKFFRKGHLAIILNKSDDYSSTKKKLSDKEIKKLYKNSPKYEINKKEFSKYISKLKNKNSFEGIWAAVEPYTIGIIKDSIRTGIDYIGFIVDSKSPYWQKNQIKLEIFKNDNGNHDMKYYSNNHSIKLIKNVEVVGNNYLLCGSFALKRVKPNFKTIPIIETYIWSHFTQHYFIEKISENTVYFRIPSFRRSGKKIIDSLLKQNDSLIKNTQNLIIDLQNNYGGDNVSFNNLIPYLYTNPIRSIGTQFLSTKLNNKRMLDFMNDDDWSKEDKEWARNGLEKLNKHIGKFVNLEEDIVSIDTLNSIFPYPKNVAILINNNCKSATEQFLLKAKQSKKVKLYGSTTSGVIDISDTYSVKSPCGEYTLWYALSKSYRIPDMTIDEKGIQPDYYYDKSIKPYEWIQKTEKILNYK